MTEKLRKHLRHGGVILNKEYYCALLDHAVKFGYFSDDPNFPIQKHDISSSAQAIKEIAEYLDITEKTACRWQRVQTTVPIKRVRERLKKFGDKIFIGTNRSYNDLMNEHQGQVAKYQELKTQNQELMEQYQELKARNQELTEQYHELKARNQELTEQYQELKVQNQELKVQNQELAKQEAKSKKESNIYYKILGWYSVVSMGLFGLATFIVTTIVEDTRSAISLLCEIGTVYLLLSVMFLMISTSFPFLNKDA